MQNSPKHSTRTSTSAQESAIEEGNDEAAHRTAKVHRMPTSKLLDRLDPLRHPLRERAELEFSTKNYAGFRDWLARDYPLWIHSPTACFIAALSMVYQVQDHPLPVAESNELLEQANTLIDASRSGWDIVFDETGLTFLEAEGLGPLDQDLIETSLVNVRAWVTRLRGKRTAARDQIIERVHQLAEEVGTEHPDILAQLLCCSFRYLLCFAADDKSEDEIRAALDLIENTISGGLGHPDLEAVRTSIATEEIFAPVIECLRKPRGAASLVQAGTSAPGEKEHDARGLQPI